MQFSVLLINWTYNIFLFVLLCSQYIMLLLLNLLYGIQKAKKRSSTSSPEFLYLVVPLIYNFDIFIEFISLKYQHIIFAIHMRTILYQVDVTEGKSLFQALTLFALSSLPLCLVFFIKWLHLDSSMIIFSLIFSSLLFWHISVHSAFNLYLISSIF